MSVTQDGNAGVVSDAALFVDMISTIAFIFVNCVVICGVICKLLFEIYSAFYVCTRSMDEFPRRVSLSYFSSSQPHLHFGAVAFTSFMGMSS